MLMIDFTKAVVINKEDEQVKSMKLVGKGLCMPYLFLLLHG